jgi:hypothetical protein
MVVSSLAAGYLHNNSAPGMRPLPLILAMAFNIESIDLAVSAPAYMDITREVLGGSPFKMSTSGNLWKLVTQPLHRLCRS